MASFERLRQIWETQSASVTPEPSQTTTPEQEPNEIKNEAPPRPPISTKPSKATVSTESLPATSKQRRPPPAPPVMRTAPPIPPKHTKASYSADSLQSGLTVPPSLPERSLSTAADTSNVDIEHEGYSSESDQDDHYEIDESSVAGPQSRRAPGVLPDVSQANRRKPFLKGFHPVNSKTQFYSAATSNNLVVTGSHHVRIYDAMNMNGNDAPFFETAERDTKITSITFKQSNSSMFWGGTKDGSLFEMDSIDGKAYDWSMHQHTSAIIGIWRLNNHMITLDDTGTLKVWLPVTHEDGSTSPTLNSPHKLFKVNADITFVNFLGDKLWLASSASHNSESNTSRSITVRVYDPVGAVYGGTFNLTPNGVMPTSTVQQLAVTSGTIIPSIPSNVYLGHQGGFVSVWSASEYDFRSVTKVSSTQVDALAGVGGYLWAGFHSGKINVLDTNQGSITDWRVVQTWQAHKEKVLSIQVDTALLEFGHLAVITTGADWNVNYWDGMLKTAHISTELQNRENSFCSFSPVRLLIVSWNTDASKPSDLVDKGGLFSKSNNSSSNSSFLKNALHSTNSPDIIVFGFQELIDLEDKKLTAKTMLLSKKKADNALSERISHSYRLWYDHLVMEVKRNMPEDSPYVVLHAENLVGLFTCIFIRKERKDDLADVAITTVKTGLKGRYGNKGAIISRFVVDDSSLCFVNCHLAAGQKHTKQRNADLVSILEEKVAFADEPVRSDLSYVNGGDGSSVFDHEMTFLNGDLNYRIDLRREAVIPAISKSNFEYLLHHDQLNKQMETNAQFKLRDFKEPPITYAPTYKYDRKTDVYDTSDKRRIPAWCDRILSRTVHLPRVNNLHYKRYEVNVSDHRPISAAFEIMTKKIDHKKRIDVLTKVEDESASMFSQTIQDEKNYYEYK
ncbi:DNase I-like protein [Wallemia mellicola]|uniref:DNase I-like protein n=1 Tax=Wallemia mellicola TaxID=1708541 RepID=A0A4T0NIK3_9BASI|nr:DNase I-like protein [Wallemia mellicola]